MKVKDSNDDTKDIKIDEDGNLTITESTPATGTITLKDKDGNVLL